MSRSNSDVSDDEGVQVEDEIEEQEEYEDTESEGDHDELDYDVEIELDESEYIDECPVNISHFDLIKKLGTGAYGTVFLVRKNCGIDFGEIYALKVISKAEVVKVPKTVIHMKAERKALEILRECPYIQKLYYAFQTGDKLFLVTDYMPGGEMFTLLQKGALPEQHVRVYMAELVIALEHIHKHGIVYRDIKLENVLIDAEGHIKLVDFGLCKKLGPRGRSKSFCGTEEYMAPEVIACTGHNTAADWWALGVLAIELLTTVTPFGTNEVPNAIMTRISNEAPIMPQNITDEMKDFITKVLIKNPAHRLGGSDPFATEIRAHRLFHGIDWEKLESKLLPAPIVPTITHQFDTQNFSEEFTQQPASYEPSDTPPESFLTFKGYSFIAPELHQMSDQQADGSIDENWNSLTRDIFSNRDPNSEFYQKYGFMSNEPLGNGKSSVCMKCFNLSDNIVYAVKIYKRQDQKDYEIEVLQNATAKCLKGVLHLVEVLTDSNWTYLIMELVEGINLLEYFDTISLRGKIVYDAFNALWTIVKNVHSLKYAHGRICFKNFRYLPSTSDFRLIGFSNAKPITAAQDEQIDYWSLGVCIYTVLCGHPPFDLQTSNMVGVTHQINSNDFEQHSDQWTALHKDIKCFIDQLLCSSIPTCSSDELKLIKKSSVHAVNYCEQQIDENESIIAIRSTTVQNQLDNKTPKCNGIELITNGNEHTDGDVVMREPDDTVNHSESRSNPTEINGQFVTATKTKRKPGHKKRRSRNSEKSLFDSVPLLKPEEIKVEQRELRKKQPVNYAHTVNFKMRRSGANKLTEKSATVTKNETEITEIKNGKIKRRQKAQKTQPNSNINKTRGRPRKVEPNLPERRTNETTATPLETTSVPTKRPKGDLINRRKIHIIALIVTITSEQNFKIFF